MLLDKIKQVYYNNKGLYGSPRIAMALSNVGIFVSKNRVTRHIKKISLQAKTHKKKRNSYRKVEESLISENLVKQCFSTNSKNKVWLGDILKL